VGRRRGDDDRRRLALRGLGARQGRFTRPVRGPAEPRALGEGDGRAPGDAARDEILTPSVPFRCQRDPRQPGEPLLLRLVVQEEDRAGLGVRRLSLGVANSMPPVAMARSDSISTSTPLSRLPCTLTPLVSQNAEPWRTRPA